MTFIASAKASDIPAGTMKSVSVEGKKILLANVSGNFYAIASTCTHMGADLCAGKLTGDLVTCPKHGAVFNVTDGLAVGPAKILFLKMKPKNVASYSVRVANDQISIEI